METPAAVETASTAPLVPDYGKGEAVFQTCSGEVM
jgi:hypothetical protein